MAVTSLAQHPQTFVREAEHDILKPDGDWDSRQKLPATAISWNHQTHPNTEQVCINVHQYFLDRWDFPNAAARKKFVEAGFPEVTCLYFPLSKPSRMAVACRLLTILFLIDDILEHLSFEDGQIYNERLMPFMSGTSRPVGDDQVEHLMYEIWEDMRMEDRHLAELVVEPTFRFMKAQTNKERLSISSLGNYLAYREDDVGQALLSALMRFCMDLDLSADERAHLKNLERYCARHISVINDVYSFEKELKAAQQITAEGSVLCTAVKILAGETDLSIGSTKRLLLQMATEWQLMFDDDAHESRMIQESDRLKLYIQGLRLQMSGNREWSRTTRRYHAR